MAFICGSYTSTLFLGSSGAQLLFNLSKQEMAVTLSITSNIHACLRGGMRANSDRLSDAINDLQLQNMFDPIEKFKVKSEE